MPDTDVKFSISVDKNEYRSGEDIRCKMTLTNTSGKSLHLNKRFLVNLSGQQHDVYFEIVDASGRKAPFGLLVNAGKPEKDDFEQLESQASVEKSINLASDFKIDPGSYTVKATYENKTSPLELDASRVWKGKIESNVLNITVS